MGALFFCGCAGSPSGLRGGVLERGSKRLKRAEVGAENAEKRKDGRKENMELEIVYLSPHELTPYEHNAKLHSETQIKNVAESIRQFGFRQPIVVDRNNVIIVGHCRALAAIQLGLESVPVHYADGLTEDEIRELRIVDNKTAESEWDFETLKREIKDLDLSGFDLGFEDLRQTAETDEKDEQDENRNVICPRCGYVFKELEL